MINYYALSNTTLERLQAAEFSVAVPQPDELAAPVTMGMAREAETLTDFINTWLRLKRENKTVDRLYRHWILGGGAELQ